MFSLHVKNTPEENFQYLESLMSDFDGIFFSI